MIVECRITGLKPLLIAYMAGYGKERWEESVNNDATERKQEQGMVVSCVLQGTLPLLVHSQRGMNYRDPVAQELQALNSKRGKTLEDRLRISDLEMTLGYYWDDRIGPYFPAINVKRSFQDGAKKFKLGTALSQSLRQLPGQDRAPILYEGPRTLGALCSEGRFRDVRTVSISGRTVERTRPIFPEWKLAVLFILDDDELDLRKLQQCADRAGGYIGLGDFRPEYGTYRCEIRETKLDDAHMEISGYAAV